MDETLGTLAQEYFGEVVTANLTVTFLKPTPIEEPLAATARLISHDGRKIHLAGELQLQRTSATLATASGLFVTVGDDHHDRHAEWLRQQNEVRA
jgi:acyl-CoA thioesterase FadM